MNISNKILGLIIKLDMVENIIDDAVEGDCREFFGDGVFHTLLETVLERY